MPVNIKLPPVPKTELENVGNLEKCCEIFSTFARLGHRFQVLEFLEVIRARHSMTQKLKHEWVWVSAEVLVMHRIFCAHSVIQDH